MDKTYNRNINKLYKNKIGHILNIKQLKVAHFCVSVIIIHVVI
jgi:hypothetical protein